MKYPFDLSYVPPATISTFLSAFAASMYFASLSNDFSSMTALTKLEKSSVGPILNDARSGCSPAFTSSQRFEGMYAREAAEHFCPWYSNAPRESAVITAAASADLCTMTKSFPPVSPTIRGYDLYL